jgi:hypothetical protein
LYFGSSLFWECDTVFEKEADTNHGGLEAHFKALVYPEMEDGEVLQQQHQKDGFGSPESRKIVADPLLKKWTKMLFDFTGRHLTFPGDRLPAIAGLITHYSQRTSWTDVLGLWKEHLLISLLWHILHDTCRSHRSTSWPTWSWISVQGHVASASRKGRFLAEAYFDELNNSAVVVHGIPFKLSDLGTWAYFSSVTREHEKTDSSIEWDTTETNFTTQPFGVPLKWSPYAEWEWNASDNDRVILECLCLVADGSTGSYRRCSYIHPITTMKTALEYDIRSRPMQAFRLV